MKLKTWLAKNSSSLEDKVIVITGTTGGLGLETLKILASLSATLIIGVRKLERAKTQCEEIENKTGCKKITILHLDLCDENSMKTFANSVEKLCPEGIDALINNAGAYPSKNSTDIYGLKMHFFTNCIAPLYLSKLLLPSLNKKKNSKLVFVGSISYKFTKIDTNDIDFKNRKSLIGYSNTKRWLTYAVQELKPEIEKSYSNVCVNLCHPGICASSLLYPKTSKVKKFFYIFLNLAQKTILPSTKKASLNEVYSLFVFTKNGEWIGPKGRTDIYGYPKIKKLKLKKEKNDINLFIIDKIKEIIKNIE